MPSPARRIGTTTNFLPAIRHPMVCSRGVRTPTLSSARSRVTSYAISIAISSTNSLNSFFGVSTLLSSVIL